mmetsp:Transcript_180587/g.439454  ORF Transcript_180587/g.439454 Transcript_180587/m.439454 type:complete len:422 (+) Transcript_180587:3-1268(+)
MIHVERAAHGGSSRASLSSHVGAGGDVLLRDARDGAEEGRCLLPPNCRARGLAHELAQQSGKCWKVHQHTRPAAVGRVVGIRPVLLQHHRQPVHHVRCPHLPAGSQRGDHVCDHGAATPGAVDHTGQHAGHHTRSGRRRAEQLLDGAVVAGPVVHLDQLTRHGRVRCGSALGHRRRACLADAADDAAGVRRSVVLRSHRCRRRLPRAQRRRATGSELHRRPAQCAWGTQAASGRGSRSLRRCRTRLAAGHTPRPTADLRHPCLLRRVPPPTDTRRLASRGRRRARRRQMRRAVAAGSLVQRSQRRLRGELQVRLHVRHRCCHAGRRGLGRRHATDTLLLVTLSAPLLLRLLLLRVVAARAGGRRCRRWHAPATAQHRRLERIGTHPRQRPCHATRHVLQTRHCRSIALHQVAQGLNRRIRL